MSDAELRDALDGLFAFDGGCVDSGIHDESLRAQAKDALALLDRAALARLVRDMWLSDESIAQGYGTEDVAEFIQWLDDRMGGYIR